MAHVNQEALSLFFEDHLAVQEGQDINRLQWALSFRSFRIDISPEEVLRIFDYIDQDRVGCIDRFDFFEFCNTFNFEEKSIRELRDRLVLHIDYQWRLSQIVSDDSIEIIYSTYSLHSRYPLSSRWNRNADKDAYFQWYLDDTPDTQCMSSRDALLYFIYLRSFIPYFLCCFVSQRKDVLCCSKCGRQFECYILWQKHQSQCGFDPQQYITYLLRAQEEDDDISFLDDQIEQKSIMPHNDTMNGITLLPNVPPPPPLPTPSTMMKHSQHKSHWIPPPPPSPSYDSQQSDVAIIRYNENELIDILNHIPERIPLWNHSVISDMSTLSEHHKSYIECTESDASQVYRKTLESVVIELLLSTEPLTALNRSGTSNHSDSSELIGSSSSLHSEAQIPSIAEIQRMIELKELEMNMTQMNTIQTSKIQYTTLSLMQSTQSPIRGMSLNISALEDAINGDSESSTDSASLLSSLGHVTNEANDDNADNASNGDAASSALSNMSSMSPLTEDTQDTVPTHNGIRIKVSGANGSNGSTDDVQEEFTASMSINPLMMGTTPREKRMQMDWEYGQIIDLILDFGGLSNVRFVSGELLLHQMVEDLYHCRYDTIWYPYRLPIWLELLFDRRRVDKLKQTHDISNESEWVYDAQFMIDGQWNLFDHLIHEYGIPPPLRSLMWAHLGFIDMNRIEIKEEIDRDDLIPPMLQTQWIKQRLSPSPLQSQRRRHRKLHPELADERSRNFLCDHLSSVLLNEICRVLPKECRDVVVEFWSQQSNAIGLRMKNWKWIEPLISDSNIKNHFAYMVSICLWDGYLGIGLLLVSAILVAIDSEYPLQQTIYGDNAPFTATYVSRVRKVYKLLYRFVIHDRIYMLEDDRPPLSLRVLRKLCRL